MSELEKDSQSSQAESKQSSCAIKNHSQDLNSQLLAKIFKLNIDCFDELFEWLSRDDLDTLGQTCKLMQSIVGEFFQQNFPAIEVRAEEDGLYVNDTRNVNCYRGAHKIHSFDKFIRKVSICENSIGIEDGVRLFCYVGSNCTKSIKHIQFINVLLTQIELEWVDEILKTVETVSIEDCLIKRQFYEKFPALCHNLKNLNVQDCRWNRNVLKRTGNEWLQRKYPKLEHLEWTQSSKKGRRIDEFKTFFELNPQIVSFSTSFHCFWGNRELIAQANIKLDDLTIEFDDWTWTPTNINATYSLLNSLHEQGIYKRLNLYARYYDADYFSKMASIRPLYSLHLHEISSRYNLPHLPQLRELRIQYINTNLDNLPNQLPNLERIYFKFAETKHFLPFIYRCPKLKEMKIDVVHDRAKFNCILDLPALNRDRKKLDGARKITIFIDEHVFLATKWATERTEFSLIEIQRGYTREWNRNIEFH
ncbi:uncharacterized protein LOC129568074 isoform X1 [Sitodiplosis mosellana]|uniref:uncharacterized protein LOC129568074 isoform X1 n=1 Tax=Sitodiplosis mosellana TaxID=263140 RepID=UPI002443C329|nr:uncharacterized protein LOC129568074 isoform X1 [Sitodiplosis mosellana]